MPAGVEIGVGFEINREKGKIELLMTKEEQ